LAARQTSRVPALLDDAELLRRLIGFNSVSRNSNLPIADFIADYLDRPGVRSRRNRNPDETKTNLVVESGPETDPESRDGLILSGHMDVVPADEVEWVSDPFRMAERDNAYVGRGTADMKGFLALAMNRLARQDLVRLRRPLALLFTFDEELGTLGAEHFARTWPAPEQLPRHVVIGEPTSLQAVRMHKGHLKLRLTTHGVSAHSGYPHLGKSAIEPAARAVTALAGLRQQLEAERPALAEHFGAVPFVALNTGLIHGGAALNIIPDRCEIEIGIRVLPGMRSDDLVRRVREVLTAALPNDNVDLAVAGDSPPFLLAEDRPIHRHACAVAHQSGSASVAFATDAGWLQTLGFDCVIFGPGTIEVAHQPNESIPIDEFRRGGVLLEELIHRCCIAEAVS
jgi:acetylornithine deacetylase